MGDANKNAFFKGNESGSGAVFRYNANFRWAFKGNLMGTGFRQHGRTGKCFSGQCEASFSRSLVELGGQMEFNFFPYSDKFVYAGAKRFTPYVFLGLELHTEQVMKRFSIEYPVRVGVKYKIKNRINLGCEFSFRKLFRR